MKLKYDFVTNSSSASFVLYIETMEPDIESFKQSLKKLIEYYKTEELPYINVGHEYKDSRLEYEGAELKNIMNSVVQVTKHVYSVEVFTVILNSLLMDTPNLFKWMVLESMTVGLFNRFGINDVRLKIINEGGGHYGDGY